MQRHHLRNSALSLGSFFFLFGFSVLPQPAQAGFQWVAPEPAPMVQAPAPLPQDAPVIIGGEMPPLSMEPQIISGPDGGVDVVQGFADQVPLSVALRQILPGDVGFSVAQDVSLGTLVSWQGGAPWRVVMKDMLAPHDLTIREEGKLVHIVHKPRDEKTMPSQAPVAEPVFAPKAAAPVALAPIPESAIATREPEIRYAPQLKGYSSSQPQNLGVLSSPTQSAAPVMLHAGAGMGAETWQAHKGQMLRDVLIEWGRRANVDVSWQAEYDYPFQASVSMMGTFEDAVRKLLEGFQDADPKPVGHLYNNQSAGQRVLVIQTRGNNYAK